MRVKRVKLFYLSDKTVICEGVSIAVLRTHYRPDQVPADAVQKSYWVDWDNRCFWVRVESKQFPNVPEGQELPRVDYRKLTTPGVPTPENPESDHAQQPEMDPEDGWPRYYRHTDNVPGIAYLRATETGKAEWITLGGKVTESVWTAEDAERFTRAGSLTRITSEEAGRIAKTVAVDLDGVLARFDGWQGLGAIGDPIPGAVEFTQSLAAQWRVLIWTTRCNAEVNGESSHLLANRVRAWLDRYGFAYDDVFVGSVKPIADAYIDDRAVACRPQSCAMAYERALTQGRKLCEGPSPSQGAGAVLPSPGKPVYESWKARQDPQKTARNDLARACLTCDGHEEE
jgi:hypothetical protein